jgi:hypothetical protein
MVRNYKKRRSADLPYDVNSNVWGIIGDEVTRIIEDYYLESYETFKNVFNESKKVYNKLKENDNWALYDSFSNYPESYIKPIFEKAKELYEEGSDSFTIDLLESDELRDNVDSIAYSIIEDAIKGIKKR